MCDFVIKALLCHNSFPLIFIVMVYVFSYFSYFVGNLSKSVSLVAYLDPLLRS